MSEKLSPHFVKPSEDMTQIGNIAMFPRLRILTGQDGLIKLTEEEFRLFKLLLENMNNVVSANTIKATLWPSGERSPEAIRQIVFRLDRAIKSITDAVLIKNSYGAGYYLLAL